MADYVAGFLFSNDLQHVVLIRKKRPAWMAGFCNAVGGHIERDEIPVVAMTREFMEEAGLFISKWSEYTTLHTRGGIIHWYWATAGVATLHASKTQTDEEIQVYLVEHVLMGKVAAMTNLNWLIGMAINSARGIDTCAVFTVVERIYRDELPKEAT